MSHTIVIGVTRFSLVLNNEQLDGILNAWMDLFPETCEDSLVIYLPDGSLHPAFKQSEYVNEYEDEDDRVEFDQWSSSKWDKTHRLIREREFFNDPDYPYSFIQPGKSWLECLQSLLSPKNKPIKRYTFVTLKYGIKGDMYDPVIVNEKIGVNEFVVRHTDTLDYIQGYIALCNWTQINWKDHIKLVHDGNSRFPLTSW